ncbi:MAG TPA: glycerophosphodiester phosphodiesterase family protein, partial [Mucilaginibacter sp.]
MQRPPKQNGGLCLVKTIYLQLMKNRFILLLTITASSFSASYAQKQVNILQVPGIGQYARIDTAGIEGFKPNPAPRSKHQFIVAAHRGDHVIYPENTLAAYEEAIKNEADYVEIDLRTTKDGELVSMHDGTVKRMTNGTGNIKDLTFNEVEQLIVKSKDTTDKTVYRIPSFKQILTLCKGRINIYLDFKAADPEQAYRMIKQYGMEKQVL